MDPDSALATSVHICSHLLSFLLFNIVLEILARDIKLKKIKGKEGKKGINVRNKIKLGPE